MFNTGGATIAGHDNQCPLIKLIMNRRQLRARVKKELSYETK